MDKSFGRLPTIEEMYEQTKAELDRATTIIACLVQAKGGTACISESEMGQFDTTYMELESEYRPECGLVLKVIER